MNDKSQHIRGTAMMIAAVIVLSPDSLLISLIAADRWTLIFWRGLLSGLTLGVSMFFDGSGKPLQKIRDMGGPGIISAILFSLSTICFVFSVSLTTAANTLVIMAATPLFAALFTSVFLRELIPARTWIAVMVGFSGLAILFWGSIGGGKITGDILAVMCACIIAGNFVLIRRYRQIDMIPAVAFSGILTALSVLPMCDGIMLQSSDILYLILMGTIVLPIPLAVFTIVPKLITAAEVSLILLLETFLGPLWVWMAIGQEPSFRTVIGGVVLTVTIAVHSFVGLRVRNGEGAVRRYGEKS